MRINILQQGKKIEDLTLDDDAQSDKAAAKPVRITTPWLLKNQDAIARIGASKELSTEIFALSAEKPVASRVYKVEQAYYVVVLKERQVPDLAKFTTQKDQLREQGVWMKRSHVIKDWIKSLRDKAHVEINPAVLDAKAKA